MSSYYGEVEYFATHMFEKNHYLAYVQNYKDTKHNVDARSGIVVTTCGELGVYEWIDVGSIECLVGIFVSKGTRYIVDKYSFTFRTEMGL